METDVLIAIIGGFVSIIVAVIGGFFNILKQLRKVTLELSPNGGNSVKDQLSRLENRHDKIEDRIDHIYETLMRGKFDS